MMGDSDATIDHIMFGNPADSKHELESAPPSLTPMTIPATHGC